MDDRALLARLVRLGRVIRRDGAFEQRHPEVAGPFVADIERRASGRARGMDTVRPKNQKRRKRR